MIPRGRPSLDVVHIPCHNSCLNLPDTRQVAHGVDSLMFFQRISVGHEDLFECYWNGFTVVFAYLSTQFHSYRRCQNEFEVSLLFVYENVISSPKVYYS